jgi:hypothetical protein
LDDLDFSTNQVSHSKPEDTGYLHDLHGGSRSSLFP